MPGGMLNEMTGKASLKKRDLNYDWRWSKLAKKIHREHFQQRDRGKTSGWDYVLRVPGRAAKEASVAEMSKLVCELRRAGRSPRALKSTVRKCLLFNVQLGIAAVFEQKNDVLEFLKGSQPGLLCSEQAGAGKGESRETRWAGRDDSCLDLQKSSRRGFDSGQILDIF